MSGGAPSRGAPGGDGRPGEPAGAPAGEGGAEGLARRGAGGVRGAESEVVAARLHVESRGDGPTVVFLHGFAGSARNWRPQVRALGAAAPPWRTVCYDARGHARSEAPTSAHAYGPAASLFDLDRVLEAEVPAGERFVLCGLSMGAGVALRFAARSPERLAGLVVAAFPRVAEEAAHRAWCLGFADALERDGLELAGESFAWGARSRFDPAGARLIRQGFLEHPPHGLAHTLRELLALQPSPETLRPVLAQLDVPTLVIVGGDDAPSLPWSRTIAEAVAGARLVVVEHAGHVVNLAAPESFNAHLLEFLSELHLRH